MTFLSRKGLHRYIRVTPQSDFTDFGKARAIKWSLPYLNLDTEAWRRIVEDEASSPALPESFPHHRCDSVWSHLRESLHIVHGSSRGHATLWVWSKAAWTWLPSSIPAEDAELISTSLEDKTPDALPRRVLNFLFRLGVFPAGQADETASEERKTRFLRGGFVSLDGLLPPAHLVFLREYYRRLRTLGEMKPDKMVQGRQFSHNDPVSRIYHQALTHAVSNVVGRDLKPSYVYVGSYRRGSALAKHTDRRQCEYTLTMQIDFEPEPIPGQCWPLHLSSGDMDHAVEQRIGDALLFKGRVLPHYRAPLEIAEVSTSVFFHYVHENFWGGLD